MTADDDVILPGAGGCEQSKLESLHAGAIARLDERAASKAWPADIAALPYVVRSAIPVIITLDGGVFYPQLVGTGPAVASTDSVLSAQFLGQLIVVTKNEIN